MNICAPLAQLVRASVLWAESRGFKSHMEHLSGYPSLVKGERLKIACEMLRGFKSHTWHIKTQIGKGHAVLAQLVERQTFNLVAQGSSPWYSIKSYNWW